MIAVSLVHIAMLTNFAVAHFDGNCCTSVAVKTGSPTQTNFSGWRWNGDSTDSGVERVVLREPSLCEKCGLGHVPAYEDWGSVDPQDAPIDEETAALRDKARKFASSIEWIAKRKDLHCAKLEAPKRENWAKLFAAQWDEDGGFTLGGKYFPQPPSPPIDSFPLSAFCPDFQH
jgi:hypothetical protein